MDHQEQLLVARFVRDMAVERLLYQVQEIGLETFRAAGLPDVVTLLREAIDASLQYNDVFWRGVAALNNEEAA